MSDDIKPGDLVMIVRPTLCCGLTDYIGYIFVAADVSAGCCECQGCGREHSFFSALDEKDGLWTHVHRLKKIDPPSEGDSLPIRADKEITA